MYDRYDLPFVSAKYYVCYPFQNHASPAKRDRSLVNNVPLHWPQEKEIGFMNGVQRHLSMYHSLGWIYRPYILAVLPLPLPYHVASITRV